MCDLEKALACFDLCIELNPNFSFHYINKAQVLEYMHKLDDAIEVLNKAIKLNPYNPDAFLQKGNLEKIRYVYTFLFLIFILIRFIVIQAKKA